VENRGRATKPSSGPYWASAQLKGTDWNEGRLPIRPSTTTSLMSRASKGGRERERPSQRGSAERDTTHKKRSYLQEKELGRGGRKTSLGIPS